LRQGQPVPGALSLLHSFGQDAVQRRQYNRVEIQFPLWLLKDVRGEEPVPGIGIEIAGGGLQFLLELTIENQCSLAFELSDRRMRANVMVVQSASCEFRGRTWQRYRAKFVGLLSRDFDLIIAFTSAHAQPNPVAAPALRPAGTNPKKSVGAIESYDMLPLRIQEMIVRKLVQLKRLVAPLEIRLALLAAHYGGIQPTSDGYVYHRFFIRTRLNTKTGVVVYNTEVLVSDDGKDLIVRE
jgi:hypothetical protein